jgi:hypothetical protein
MGMGKVRFAVKGIEHLRNRGTLDVLGRPAAEELCGWKAAMSRTIWLNHFGFGRRKPRSLSTQGGLRIGEGLCFVKKYT